MKTNIQKLANRWFKDIIQGSDNPTDLSYSELTFDQVLSLIVKIKGNKQAALEIQNSLMKPVGTFDDLPF